MRKILTVLAILIFLFSCSSTKDVVLVEEDSVVEEIPTVYEEDEVVVPPPVEEAIPEVEQEPAVPEVVEIEDAADEVAEPVITTEEVLPEVDATQQSPITIVEEISEKIVEPLIAETGEDNEDASFENEEGEPEKVADAFARDKLIPPSEYENFIENRDFSLLSIRRFAEKIQRDPAIVLGRLQNDKIIGFDDIRAKQLRRKYKICISSCKQ